MDRLHRAIKDVHRLDDLAARDTWLNRLAPLPKLLAAVVYLAVTLSFGRYQLTGVLGMGLWPLLLLELADFTPGDALRAFKPVAVLLTVVGLCNLPFDRAVLLHAGPLSVTGGMLSLGVLLTKGLFCFLAVWVLIASTGMESVCAALQQLHCPRVLTTTILLIYRYIVCRRVSALPPPMRCAHPGKRASSSGRGAHCWGNCYCAASTAPSWCTRACSCGALQDLFRQGRKSTAVGCFWQ